MKILVITLALFGFTSGALASGINCKNEAAGYALTQIIMEVVKAGKSVADYKFRADRPQTDDSIELKNGDVRETYIVPVFLYKGITDADIELPGERTVRVDILNTRSGDCNLEKIYKSDGE